MRKYTLHKLSLACFGLSLLFGTASWADTGVMFDQCYPTQAHNASNQRCLANWDKTVLLDQRPPEDKSSPLGAQLMDAVTFLYAARFLSIAVKGGGLNTEKLEEVAKVLDFYNLLKLNEKIDLLEKDHKKFFLEFKELFNTSDWSTLVDHFHKFFTSWKDAIAFLLTFSGGDDNFIYIPANFVAVLKISSSEDPCPDDFMGRFGYYTKYVNSVRFFTGIAAVAASYLPVASYGKAATVLTTLHAWTLPVLLVALPAGIAVSMHYDSLSKGLYNRDEWNVSGHSVTGIAEQRTLENVTVEDRLKVNMEELMKGTVQRKETSKL